MRQLCLGGTPGGLLLELRMKILCNVVSQSVLLWYRPPAPVKSILKYPARVQL